MKSRGQVPALILLVSLVECGGQESQVKAPLSLRLVDLFSEATVTGSPESPSSFEPVQWRFEETSEPDFQAGSGVDGLAVRDGLLVGRTTTAIPILHSERLQEVDEDDVLERVEVRARVSAGANLAVSFARDESVDIDRILEQLERSPWQLTTPLLVGDDIQTYSISASASTQTSIGPAATRHVLIRPTDVAEADFAIESIRLVYRKEHLASIPAGASWQGLSEIYRETLVARSPETLQFRLTLPSEPLLDLAVGTVETAPLTFRVDLKPQGTESEQPVLERTVTTANQWQEVQVDLSAFGGQEVDLSLELESDREGTLGFWGAPAIRQRIGDGSGEEGAPRGVIVVLIDTLRRDHLDSYGYGRKTAPRLTQLAQQGTLFQDAIAQGAWTKVSVPSALSSTYPTSNGIYEFFHKLPASADTLAESFRAAGYATWAGSANGFSGRGNNLHQGLEVMHERSSIDLPEGTSRSKTARVLVDRLLPWLESHRDVPFFVFLHPIDPHSPYEPYAPYDTLWGHADAKEKHDESTNAIGDMIRERRRQGGLPHREDLVEAGVDVDAYLERELAWYDGSVRGADTEVGRVFEALRQLDLEDDTLVVFFSDHGEEFLDHGGHFHEENLYGELTNVPLIVRWPGRVPAGAVVEDTVELIDLSPTILDLVGLPIPESMQGQSLVPLLSAASTEWSERPAFSEWKKRTDQQGLGIVDAQSVILGDYKLVHNVDRPTGEPEYELYHHRDDPLDQNDIAAEHPEIVSRLKDELDRWYEDVVANKLPGDSEAASTMDAAELERLRSLGYVQ